MFALRLCHSHSCFTLKLVFFFPDISLTLLPFFTQSFPFSVLHETNKPDQEIQLVVFKPIPTARKYDRNNESNEEEKKIRFFFYERTETTKVMIQEQINFEKYGE